MDVTLVFPEVSDDDISDGLRALTAAAQKALPDEDWGYGLGGEHGYGVDYENDVFAMRRFYWGECDCGWEDSESEWCDGHDHSDACYQSELRREKLAAGWSKNPKWEGLDAPKRWTYEQTRAAEEEIYRRLCAKHKRPYPFGCAVHCTCDYEPTWKSFVKTHGGHKSTCSLELPNFRHKASGLEVRWYKYIGRGMECKGLEGADFPAILAECIASLPNPL